VFRKTKKVWKMSARLVVLISGNGSNLQAILDACADKTLPVAVVAVISNRPEAYGLTRAQNAGVPAIAFPRLDGEPRRDYDTRLAVLVSTYAPDYIILAGWMRLLSNNFLSNYPNRVINLHPALPGTFPGTHAIQRAYESYQRGEIDRTGVMLHLVPDEGVDDGPILATQEIFFQEGESLEQFEARVHAVEHTLLVDVLKKITTETLRTQRKP
jgi:phosphoribosylglycinamide formyltransferase-1